MPGRVILGAIGLAAGTDYYGLFTSRDSTIVQNQSVTFPSDIKSAYIHMRFSKYVRRSIRTQPFFEPQNGIRLPIPKELTDSVSVQYTSTELGPMVGAAADSLAEIGTSTSPLSAIQNFLSGAYNTGAGAGAQALLSTPRLIANPNTQSTLRTAAAQSFNTVFEGFQSLSGTTINPYQTILFKSPNFKKHRFSWTLVPKNEQESKDIEFILRLFKYHMLPGVSNAGVFFSYPEIVEIKLFPKDEYLYKFKPCVIESINVNYAPNGPSFYRASSAPTAVNFSINLQEIEIWTKADYTRVGEQGRPVLGIPPNLRAGL